MKTDDLVSLLAMQVEAVRPHAVERRMALALAGGVGVAALMLLAGYGLRPDLGQAMTGKMFWAKLALPLCLAATGWVLAERLARPGRAGGQAWWGVLLPLLAVWLMALAVLWQTPPSQRLSLVLGQTWHTCMASIALMALPVFAAALAAMRSLAPTRPRQAGAAAGLLAGGAGAAVYAFHCPEAQVPFLALWYVAGMALPAAVGAALGPRLLRW